MMTLLGGSADGCVSVAAFIWLRLGVLKDIADTIPECPHKLKDIPNYQESLEYSGMDVFDISQFDDVILSVLQVLRQNMEHFET